MISTTPGNTNHAHNHAHSILKPPGQLGGGGGGSASALSLALEKAAGNRARMDSQKFLIPSLPVSSRPDPGGIHGAKRRERSIVNGTASLTPATPEGGAGAGYPHLYNNYNNGVRRGSYSHSVTGLPPPTNSPRKDAHSPMYHPHHVHPLGVNEHDLHKNSYLGQQQQQHRSSVPIPCSSPARAASASPKSASAPALSPSSKSSYSVAAPAPQLPGGHLAGVGGVSDRLYTAGFPHHPNLGVSSHAAALYAAAAAAQPLPYAALFGGYPHSAAATNYLDSFHSSIMAQQQKHISAASAKPAGASPPGGGVRGAGAARGGPDSGAYYPPTATTSFHTKLIDSALPIERLYNNGHHTHATSAHTHAHNNHNHTYQSQSQAQAQRDERDRDVTGIHAVTHAHSHNHLGFPGLPNGVSVSVSKGSPGELRLGATPPNFHPPPPANSKYFNSKLSLTNVSTANANGGGKYWSTSNGHAHAQAQAQAQAQAHTNALAAAHAARQHVHGQTYQATSPGLLGNGNGKQMHEDYKSSILYGGKEGSLKHRILKTETTNRGSRSPEPRGTRDRDGDVIPLNSPIRTSNSNGKPVFQFPNLMSGPPGPTTHAHVNGSANHNHNHDSRDFYDRVNNNGGPFNYSKTAESEIYKGTLRVTTTTPPTPPFSSSSPPFKYLSQIYKPSNPRILSPAAPVSAQAHAHAHSNSNSNSPAHINSPTVPPKHGNMAMLSPKTPTAITSSPTSKTSNSNPANVQIPASGGGLNGFAKKTMNATEQWPVEKMPRLDAFHCGSLIQLASGDLRAIEDLRVEDFIKSAAKATESVKINHCTVISIQSPVEGDNHCKVTLAMGSQKHQVVVDTTPEQPFFIPGRGWSSWSPIQTQRVLQLPCTPLAVGDVCITLSKFPQAQTRSPPRSPLAKFPSAKSTNILSSPNSAKLATMAGKRGGAVNGYAKRGRGAAHIPRKLPKGLGLEAQAMLPPPTPLTPRTISKISAVVEAAEKENSSEAASAQPVTVTTTTTRPTTPKKRRWSAPEVVTDEDSGEDTAGASPQKQRSLEEPPVKIKVTEADADSADKVEPKPAVSPPAPSTSAPPITVTA